GPTVRDVSAPGFAKSSLSRLVVRRESRARSSLLSCGEPIKSSASLCFLSGSGAQERFGDEAPPRRSAILVLAGCPAGNGLHRLPGQERDPGGPPAGHDCFSHPGARG